MNDIKNLNSFKANTIQMLKASALLVQSVVKDLFYTKNNNLLLSNKKIGVVATENLIFKNKTYFCVISALCEGLDFSKIENKVFYDYNKNKSVKINNYVGSEFLPVLRIALSEEQDRAIIISDNIKFDFFEIEDSAIEASSLFFQMISNDKLVQELSSSKIKNIQEISSYRPVNRVNNFSSEWRIYFIEKQREHLKEFSYIKPDFDFISFYNELLSLELGNLPFTNKQ